MSVSVTQKASEHIQQQLQNRQKGLGIRVGVKNSGCSGFAYFLEFVDVINDDDNVFESNDVKIIVDQKSLVIIDGLVLDFVKNGLNEGFEFNNPNEKNSCGCGESFSV